MPHERLKPSFVFDEERLNQLKQIVPEAFADGKINWDTLKEALGEYQEEEGQDAEHFGLFWPGKREARKLASIPSKGTVVPVKGEGVDEENTRNIFIEGENLEVLKLLQKSYAGKIKMIYIDPPYNTGNDFVYDDNFTEPLEEYLKYTGQMDEEGKLLTTNKKADGRFHSKWLNMMYPRLRLARNLLREEGFIFVSIDDNEIHHLRGIMNEIFGEENFIDCIIWKKRYGGGAKEKYLVSVHEYILFYAKDKESLDPIYIPHDENAVEKYYKYKDDNYSLRGPYRTHPLEAGKAVGDRKNLIFPIPAPDGTMIIPKRQWYWSKERVFEAIKNNEIEFVKGKDGWTVHSKQYLKDVKGEVRQSKAFSLIDDVYTQHGTKEMIDIFKDPRVFPYPKPTGLIKVLLNIATEKENNEIILDFFAGSCTTAHAIMDLNKKDGGNRKFICCQMPEQCDKESPAYKAGYKTIADIAKDRIRKAINGYGKSASPGKTGFRVVKLTNSNFKQWQDYKGKDLKELQQVFEHWQSPLVEGWKEENLLVEILLQEGFPLDSKTEYLEKYNKNKIIQVTSAFCEHKLLVCLDKKVEQETIGELVLDSEDRFICLDSALNDEQKVRLSDKGFLKTI